MPEGDENTEKPRRRTGAEIRAKIDEAGGALRLADTLLSKIEGLERELATTKTGAALPQGAVVLKADEAALWTAYQALGTPDALKATLAETDTLKASIAESTAKSARQAAAQATAKALGWNEQAVVALVDDKRLTLELRDVEVDDGKGGKKQEKRGHVVTGDTAELFDAVAARDFAVYLPALTAATATTQGAGGQAPITYPVQRPATSSTQADDVAGSFITKMQQSASARPNPLLPKAAA